MIGLSQMAWRLAVKRAYGDSDALPISYLLPRAAFWHLMIDAFMPSQPLANNEYYRIIDRVTRGEKP